jgi:hypothetical protein
VLRSEPSEPDRASELADRDQLERGLRRLNDAQRTILALHFYVGLSVARRPMRCKSPSGLPSPGFTTPSKRFVQPSRLTSALRSAPSGRAVRHDRQS